MPVISSGENVAVPSGLRIDMSTSSRSRSPRSGRPAPPPAPAMICADQLNQPARAWSRRRKLSIGAYGSTNASASVPRSRSWYSSANRRSSWLRNFRADQAGRGGVDGQLGEPVQQVDLAVGWPTRPPSGPPRRRSSARARASCRRAAPGCAGPRGGAPARRRTPRPSPKIGVMNGYAPAWSRSSSGARKKNSLASAPGQQDHRPPGQVEPADVAALGPDPAHQRYRVAAQFLQVTVCRAAGDQPRLEQAS